MDLNQRKEWNANHKKLTNIISNPTFHQAAVDLFLSQHQLLHSSRMSQTSLETLEDVFVKDLEEETFRRYPVAAPDTKNSIAWHLWHITRIEDMTMNILVHDGEQVLVSGGWDKPLNVSYLHSGNDMTEEEVGDLSANIHISSLFEYRMAVGRRTREIVMNLQHGQFKNKVDPARIRKLEEQGAVKKESSWLLEYWGNKTIAGLILMPATRHIYLHLNKSIRIKQRIQKNNPSKQSSR